MALFHLVLLQDPSPSLDPFHAASLHQMADSHFHLQAWATDVQETASAAFYATLRVVPHGAASVVVSSSHREPLLLLSISNVPLISSILHLLNLLRVPCPYCYLPRWFFLFTTYLVNFNRWIFCSVLSISCYSKACVTSP